MATATVLSPGDIKRFRDDRNLTQERLAAELGVTKVTVARWELGERACRGRSAGRLRALMAARRRPATIWTISSHDLTRLTPVQAVLRFRDLLWCGARRAELGPTDVTISPEERQDGGIDARVRNVSLARTDRLLVLGDNYFQVKTGSSFRPTIEASVRRELFGKSHVQNACKESLGSGVLRCLTDGGRYVMACFGLDLNDKEEAKAEENFLRCFEQCGFPNARVEVWGQQKLIGAISAFPSLALKLTGRLPQFQSFESWGLNQDMSAGPLCLGDPQEQLRDKIREYLRGPDVRHIRLIGEPGVGKTRIVFEALRAPDLTPSVVYFANAEKFQESQLFNELLGTDVDYSLILVLDECLPKDCDSIWNVLRNRSDRCRIISLDHDPYSSSDPLVRVLPCPPLADDKVEAIIRGYVPRRHDARRWTEYCTGSPRMAHAIGLSLQQGSEDLLHAISFGSVVERFVAGYRQVDSSEAREKLIILRHLALFHRFGFEAPVDSEARLIFESLLKDTLPNLTWPTFQDRIKELREQRILQGSRTLFIAPKLLHVYLWTEFWKSHGRGFPLAVFLRTLSSDLTRSGGLRRWFLQMFAYAGDSSVAVEHIDSLLGKNGPFPSDVGSLLKQDCEFLCHLAEGCPQATLGYLERLLDRCDHEALLRFEEGRQHLVWALEKMAVSAEHFERAVHLLGKLAEAENATNSNNATGVFTGLFHLSPGPAAPTEAPPHLRLPILEEYLRSPSASKRQLGRKACERALSTRFGGRIIGSEYQGIRPTARLWTPKTWGEVHKAMGDVWDALCDVAKHWADEERKQGNQVLIDAAIGLLNIKSLSGKVLVTLDQLARDPATDLRAVVDVIERVRRHWRKHFPAAVVKKLETLERRVRGTTFESRLQRTVLFSSFDEMLTDDGKENPAIRRELKWLAAQATKHPAKLKLVLSELLTSESNLLHPFGYELAHADANRTLLSAIIEAYRGRREDTSPSLLNGYLAEICERSTREWERIIEGLVRDPTFKSTIGLIVRNSGFSENTGLFERVMKLIITEYEQGRLGVECLTSFRYWRELAALSDHTLFAFLDDLRGAGKTEEVLEQVDYLYCQRESKKGRLPEEWTLKLLGDHADSVSTGGSAGYHWNAVAESYCAAYPNRFLDVFQAALDKIVADKWFLTMHEPAYATLRSIVARNPSECWNVVAKRIEALDGTDDWRLLHWLGESPSFGDDDVEGPMAWFPVEAVVNWVAENPDKRAHDIARAVPKTFEGASGAFARELLNRYGDRDDVRSALFANFWCGGWCGSESEYYQKKRETARKWLSHERSSRVRRWIEDYIETLNRDVTRAEVEEERGLWP